MMLPLLESLRDLGGEATPKAVYDAVATKLALPPDVRHERRRVGVANQDINVFERDVRWARQKAVLRGWVDGAAPRNLWALTEAGDTGLRNAKAGVVVTVYETDLGLCMWAECEAATALIAPDSVNLIFTSPPYPLLRRKDYANQHADRAHVEWLARCVDQWRRVLTPDGSIMLNMGDTFLPGRPEMSLWQERLLLELVDRVGLTLCQKLFWENPAKMPAPAEWVTVRRVRVTPSVEQIWWLAKTAHPKANNRRVLREYSASMRARIAAGGDRATARPSGHVLKAGAFAADNGGSISHCLITAANPSSNDAYQRGCKALGIPAHPARFPAALAEFGIRLTTDEGDLCYDPMSGSNTFGEMAEHLGRRWLASEKALLYARGGGLRFADRPSLVTFFDRLADAA